jgi:hypothetical protein
MQALPGAHALAGPHVPSAPHVLIASPVQRDVPGTQVVAQVASVGGRLLLLLFGLNPGTQLAGSGQRVVTNL